jgi:3-hydroxyisobutyrate dehydrogenase
LVAVTEIAVLGTGTMGAAIARRLLTTGHRVTVWNRTQPLGWLDPEAGATVAATPGRAVAGADLVIVMLTDAAAVSAVLGEAAPALRPGTVVVQMSTIGPDEVRAIAERLAVPLLDAPVGGSVTAAEGGTLTIFTGGERALVNAAEPVLRDLGTLRHCGPVGAAAATKLVVNTAMLTALAALRDALAVADTVGLDRKTALDTLTAGPLGGAVGRATATGAAFAVSLAAKDLTLALRDLDGVPVARATLRLLRAAGDQRADVATIVEREQP